jgi:glycosyltransferase involved in cell wall biosynthesis
MDKPFSGIHTYGRFLIPELLNLQLAPIILAPAQLALPPSPGAQIELIKSFGPLGRSKIGWSFLTGRFLKGVHANKPLVYHGFANINLPVLTRLNSSFKFVVTVHDLIPLLIRKGVGTAYYQQFAWALPRVLGLAHAVVCVSNWTRQSILERFPWAEKKTYVIPNGYDHGRVQHARRERQEKRYVELLVVARFESYKRLDLVLKILSLSSDRYRISVVSDPNGVKFLHKNGGKFLQAGTLRVFSKLDSVSLNQLYSSADVLLHPSLFEGFCLPAAEAVCHGIPVVYCQGSGIDDILGKSCGVGLNGSSEPEQWNEAIEAAYTMSRSAKFLQDVKNRLSILPTWQDSAKKLKDLYNSI